MYAELAQRIHTTHEDLLFGLLHFPSGTTGMLDVNWLTPAKRRQLTVVGEEGMFELDYLTQRLTFTRAATDKPALIAGYATTFAGDVAEIPVASSEPLAAEIDAFLRVVRDGGRPVVDGEDGLWAVAIANSLLLSAAERRPIDLDRSHLEASRRMTVTAAPLAAAPSMLGGSIELPVAPVRARHAPTRRPVDGRAGHGRHRRRRRRGEDGPAALRAVRRPRLAGHRGRRPGRRSSRRSTPGAPTSTASPGSPSSSRAPTRTGCLSATLDAAAAAREADVVVLIVPVMLDDEQHPDYRYMDAAVDSIAPGVHAGSTVIFETTLPVGDTRHRFAPRLEHATGLTSEEDLFVAFSPERLYSGHALAQPRAVPEARRGARRRVRGRARPRSTGASSTRRSSR